MNCLSLNLAYHIRNSELGRIRVVGENRRISYGKSYQLAIEFTT